MHFFVLGVVIVMIIVFIAGAVLCISRMKLREQMDGVMKIKNGLIVSVAIGDYETHPRRAAITRKLQSLPVGVDVQNLRNLAEFLHFEFLTIEDKMNWTKKEVIEFLSVDVMKLFLDESGQAKYDGLIVAISCHGIGNNIISSDYKLVDRTDIHRSISENYPQIRHIPRIFLFDACDGTRDRKPSAKSTGNDTLNANDEHDTDKDAKAVIQAMPLETEWTENTKNPDYDLVIVHGANSGFVSKMQTSEVGSYLTYCFTKAIRRNIERKQRKGLAVILKDIQNELHEAGKQLIRKEFFNNTDDLRIEINTVGRQ